MPPAETIVKETVIEHLMQRASQMPQTVLYEHLGDGETVSESLTAAALLGNARAIAAEIQRLHAHQQRILLLYPPGLAQVSALFGCWLAGAVAVPALAPRNASGPGAVRIYERIAGMALGSKATAVLAPGDVLAMDLGDSLAKLSRIDTDQAITAASEPSARPEASPQTLAYLQYTSGSTSEPKGVAITHGNLLQNCADVQEAYRFDEDSTLVSWVPTHHDLGLVYAVLMPIVYGFRSVTLPPETFVGRPIRWLSALSRLRGTHSVSPNFGFDLAALRTTDDERRGLDLSRWRVALNGAEPIRRATEERFAQTFAPYKFRRESLSHSYGLAESTAKVTAEREGQRVIFVVLDASSLEQGAVAPPVAGKRTAEIASCGVPASGTEVAIVDPDRRQRCDADHIGEIWLRSGSVASGYWDNETATAEVFRAEIDGRPGEYWLRTGDLGFLREGQLFVTGRSKDLLLVRGENHYPQDLEHAIQGRHPSIRPSCAVAFALDGEEGERVVIVTDVYPDKVGDPSAVFHAIREAVSEQGISADIIALTPPGTVPKTSSGKVQRKATRARWQQGSLPVIAAWEAAPRTSSAQDAPVGPIRDSVRAVPPAERRPLLEAHLCGLIASRQGLSLAEVGPEVSLKSLGVDSIAAVELGERLSTDLAVPLYPGVVQDHDNVREVVTFVLKARW